MLDPKNQHKVVQSALEQLKHLTGNDVKLEDLIIETYKQSFQAHCNKINISALW